MKSSFTTQLVSKTLLSLSESEAKRLRLTVWLCFTSMSVAIVYTVLDLSSGIYYALPFYAAIFFAPIISLVLLRNGYVLIGKVCVLIGASIAIFFASISDPFETGVYLLFVPLSIVPFAMIGFEHKWTSISIALSAFALFLISSFGDTRLPFPTELPENYIQISLCLNYVIAVTISILIVYFLIQLHKSSELFLIEREKMVMDRNLALTKLNQELDGFVYSVSHDLRSPLSSILGITNLAKYATTKEELMEYIEMIQERIKVQDSFIKDIIDYSRNARTDLQIELFNLFELTQEVLDGVKFQAGVSNMTFNVLVPADLTIESDKNRWKTILSNLISNAVKYRDPLKKNSFVEIKVVSEKGSLKFVVTDNGVGISKNHLVKIFDMFYRASDASNGSGLGLFITKEAVQKLGGSIHVESEIDKGSAFTVVVPIKSK